MEPAVTQQASKVPFCYSHTRFCGAKSLPFEQPFSFFTLPSTVSVREISRLKYRLPVEAHGQSVSEESFKQRLLVDSLSNPEMDCLCFKRCQN